MLFDSQEVLYGHLTAKVKEMRGEYDERQASEVAMLLLKSHPHAVIFKILGNNAILHSKIDAATGKSTATER